MPQCRQCPKCGQTEYAEGHNCIESLKHRVIELELSLGKKIKSESTAHTRRLSSEGLADELYSALLNVMRNNNIEDAFALEAIGSYNMYN